MDDDLDRVLGMLDIKEKLNILVLLLAPLVGVDGDDPPSVRPLEEVISLDDLLQLPGVCRVPRDDQDKRLDIPLAGLSRVLLKLRLRLLVEPDER